jgi:hypothetical protein
MAAELPWDDERRLPALLRNIRTEVLRLRRELDREARLWWQHQPGLRAEPFNLRDPKLGPPLFLPRLNLEAVGRHLEATADWVDQALEALESERPPA